MSDAKEKTLTPTTVNVPGLEDVEDPYANEPGAGTSNENENGMEWSNGNGAATGAAPTMFHDDDPERPVNNSGGFWGFMKRCWYWLTMYYYGFIWYNIQFWNKHNVLNMDKIPKRPSEMAVITGGERGIGLQVVKKLLQADMHVIIGTIDEAAATDAVAKLKQDVSTGSYEILPLDLAQTQSVRFFVRMVLERNMPITTLINNAGIMLVPFRLTNDGMESHFQVNYHGHFLLTLLLLPSLMKGGRPDKHARIVNVTSNLSFGGVFNFADLQMTKFYSTHKAYMTSKLAQIVFSNYLANKIKHAAVPPNLTISSVHPGICLTDLYNGVFYWRPFRFLYRLTWMSADQGADGVAYAALSPELEGQSGLFLFNCRQYDESPLARHHGIQENLWKMSCSLAGMSPNFELIPQAVPKISNGAAASPAPDPPPDPVLVVQEPAPEPAAVAGDREPDPDPVAGAEPAPQPAPTEPNATTSTDNTNETGVSGRVQLQEVIIMKDYGNNKRPPSIAPPPPPITEEEALERMALWKEMPEITRY